ncbi:hypothetical protein [Phenylobacterium aquaticum]|uniref:hypothetical protein n=1 Tax=Phenylobacterium aquaticum TaxID=1763816 RepID=UPI001F5D3941|nr:hypothetical protein [Phenylobacterium aquaticum]MCI3134893.1 hypothetical protein [Phenylobacterium aquaticum]
MSALLLALLLAAQDAPPAPAEPAPPAAQEEELPFPPGAPHDDYGFVGWCYGALGGYLDLHDRMIPEVTRIEGAFQAPGRTLAQDMAVYDELDAMSRTNMKLFTRAMQAAEKASLKPINAYGAKAIGQGRAGWAGANTLPRRTVAQQWMGWTLPARCVPTAKTLESRAKLLGATFQANAPAEPDPAPVEAPAAAPVASPDVAQAAPPADQPAAGDPIGDAIATAKPTPPKLRTKPQ